jgi:hypothetical protein
MPLAPPNLPNVSRVVGHYSDSGSAASAVSVWHVLSSGIAALEVFNRFSTAWQANQMAHATTTTRLHTIDVTRLDLQTATESFTTVGAKFDGLSTGQAIPQVAALVKFKTGFRGLGSQGRTFAPMVAEDVADEGRVVQLVFDLLGPAWVSFVNTLTTQTIPLQVVSYGRADHPTLPDAPATNHTVTSVSIDPILATQRNRQSRLRG